MSGLIRSNAPVRILAIGVKQGNRQNGKTAAVMIAPGDDEDLERLLLAHSPQFRALLDHARASLDRG